MRYWGLGVIVWDDGFYSLVSKQFILYVGGGGFYSKHIRVSIV